MNSRLDKLLIAAGWVGPLLFFLTIYWLLAASYPGYDPLHDYISELGAVDSPVKTLANVFGFSLCGVLLMLFAYGVTRSEEINALGKIAAVFFFLTGGLMFLVGIFNCDVGCHNYSLRGQWHNAVSDYQFPVLAVGLVLFALSVIGNPRLRILTFIILPLGLVTLGLAYRLFWVFPPPEPVGLWQRAAIGLPYLTVMLIALVMNFRKNK